MGLLGSQLLELDLASLSAGCMMPGEFEERLKAVITEISESPRRIVLFIDDIHNLVPSAANQVSQVTAGWLHKMIVMISYTSNWQSMLFVWQGMV